MRRTYGFGDLIGFHFHDSSELIDVLCVKDQPCLRHGVLDTIREGFVKM
jgi:hypothetical protein